MEYSEFIQQYKGVVTEKVCYYKIWVNKYLIYKKKNNNSSLITYLLTLETKYPPWQIQQAKISIHYYEQYLNFKAEQLKDDVKIIQKAKEELRYHQKSYNTEKIYLYWLNDFLKFCPNDRNKMDENDIKKYLSYLAVTREVAKATQKQAFNALLFSARNVFNIEISGLSDVVRSDNRKKLPVVLNNIEIKEIFQHLEGTKLLMLELIYGAV